MNRPQRTLCDVPDCGRVAWIVSLIFPDHGPEIPVVKTACRGHDWSPDGKPISTDQDYFWDAYWFPLREWRNPALCLNVTWSRHLGAKYGDACLRAIEARLGPEGTA